MKSKEAKNPTDEVLKKCRALIRTMKKGKVEGWTDNYQQVRHDLFDLMDSFIDFWEIEKDIPLCDLPRQIGLLMQIRNAEGLIKKYMGDRDIFGGRKGEFPKQIIE
jgi:hypothetical protein